MKSALILLMLGLMLGLGCYASNEFIPLAEKSQGQSLAGASLTNDSIFSNPASFTFSNIYSIDGTYAMPKSFSVSILDTQTSSIGGGLGYFRRGLGFSNSPLQGLRLALGGRATNAIGIGVTGKALWGPDRNEQSANHKDVDVGALANFGYLKAGVTAKNILGGSIPLEQDREVVAGARAQYNEQLFLSAAAHSKLENLSPFQYSAGVEYMSPYYVALKAGYRMQPSANLSWWGAGASFVSPRMSIHYAVEFPNQGQNETEHLLGMTMLM